MCITRSNKTFQKRSTGWTSLLLLDGIFKTLAPITQYKCKTLTFNLNEFLYKRMIYSSFICIINYKDLSHFMLQSCSTIKSDFLIFSTYNIFLYFYINLSIL